MVTVFIGLRSPVLLPSSVGGRPSSVVFPMTDLAIRVANLSKLYHIGPRERYRTLRDTLTTDSETAKEGNRDYGNWN